MNKINLLLVEDDRAILDNLVPFLQNEGFSVETAGTQREALEKMTSGSYDLALLDVSLPDGNGFAVCSAIKANTDMAVMFLTASSDEYSTVTGLDMGADDYLAKPFRPRELVSRIRSVLRRCGKSKSVLEIGGVRVDTERAVVTKYGKEIFLSALEYRLLLVLLGNKGAVLTRERLLEEIWDVAGDYVNDNTLTVYIKRLRDKIEDDPQEPTIIRTVRGLGYRVG
ncbi:MAG: response regulator transcription factor [Lachnospiraceae bacterium]|nr:response regulator transcription factor [Lachnospiraceae bacterium]